MDTYFFQKQLFRFENEEEIKTKYAKIAFFKYYRKTVIIKSDRFSLFESSKQNRNEK